jgi:hypothetical protein
MGVSIGSLAQQYQNSIGAAMQQSINNSMLGSMNGYSTIPNRHSSYSDFKEYERMQRIDDLKRDHQKKLKYLWNVAQLIAVGICITVASFVGVVHFCGLLPVLMVFGVVALCVAVPAGIAKLIFMHMKKIAETELAKQLMIE